MKRQEKHSCPLEGHALQSSGLWFGSGVSLQSMWCCFVRGNGLYLHEQISLKPELLCGFEGLRCLVWPRSRKLHGAFTAGLRPHCMYMLLCAAFQWICIEHLCVRNRTVWCSGYCQLEMVALKVSGEELMVFLLYRKLLSTK